MDSEIFSLLGNGRFFKGQVPCQIKSVEICRGLFSLALKRLPTAGKKYRTPAPLKAYLLLHYRARAIYGLQHGRNRSRNQRPAINSRPFAPSNARRGELRSQQKSEL